MNGIIKLIGSQSRTEVTVDRVIGHKKVITNRIENLLELNSKAELRRNRVMIQKQGSGHQHHSREMSGHK